MTTPMPKYVVFDLDETLGFFTELGIIWNCLETVYNITGQSNFNELCNIFEKDYFRPGIFKALDYLKKQGNKVRVVLYTNNTGSLEWLRMILRYMEEKINARGLFYKIVPGYKPGMRGPCVRTSFDKTYPEIIRCAEIPADAKIIFFDDLVHEKMKAPNVKYIRVRPYFRPMRPTHIIRRLQNSYFGFLNYTANTYLYRCIRSFHNTYVDNSRHHRSSRVSDDDVLKPLRKFLEKGKHGTKKTKVVGRNKTRRKEIN